MLPQQRPKLVDRIEGDYFTILGLPLLPLLAVLREQRAKLGFPFRERNSRRTHIYTGGNTDQFCGTLQSHWDRHGRALLQHRL